MHIFSFTLERHKNNNQQPSCFHNCVQNIINAVCFGTWSSASLGRTSLNVSKRKFSSPLGGEIQLNIIYIVHCTGSEQTIGTLLLLPFSNITAENKLISCSFWQNASEELATYIKISLLLLIWLHPLLAIHFYLPYSPNKKVIPPACIS